MCCDLLFFFFKQKTAYEMRISDWSSDVCSSDLGVPDGSVRVPAARSLADAVAAAGVGAAVRARVRVPAGGSPGRSRPVPWRPPDKATHSLRLWPMPIFSLAGSGGFCLCSGRVLADGLRARSLHAAAGGQARALPEPFPWPMLGPPFSGQGDVVSSGCGK